MMWCFSCQNFQILNDMTGNLDAKKACAGAMKLHKKYLKKVWPWVYALARVTSVVRKCDWICSKPIMLWTLFSSLSLSVSLIQFPRRLKTELRPDKWNTSGYWFDIFFFSSIINSKSWQKIALSHVKQLYIFFFFYIQDFCRYILYTQYLKFIYVKYKSTS